MKSLWSIVFLSLMFGSLAHAQEQAKDTSYGECTALSNDKPKQALAYAEEWVLKENSTSAMHCKAMALFALRRYDEAAEELQALSRLIRTRDPMLWANVMRQRARALVLDDQSQDAVKSLDEPIMTLGEKAQDDTTMATMAVNMLMDRSTIYTTMGKPLLAVQDLDQALSILPNHRDALYARAALFMELKQPEMAGKDLTLLLAQYPTHRKGLRLRAKLENEKN